MPLKIRTRIAPSPTGFMHIGTARTALFNYLFAKKMNGEFLLRIEDTDFERSKKEYEENIINGLKWLGLEWDGNIVYQSKRSERHGEFLKKLLESEKAFFCFHTQEELETEQKEQKAEKKVYKHECEHKNLSEEETKSKSGGIIRLKNSNKKIIFDDMIRGEVSFDSSLLGDFSLAKSLDEPLYNFAVVVDDHEMEITDVIRGEDHISNTPKQILIQEALGFERPKYAHLPLILGADRSKLSKRHGGTSLMEYQRAGYLPEAIINFMALLGWHPTDNCEIFSLEELIKEFDISRVQKAGAVLDIEKLNSINHHYIKNLVPAELAKHLEPFVEEYKTDTELVLRTADLFVDRLKKFSDIRKFGGFIFKLPEYESKLLIWKGASENKTQKSLELSLSVLEKIDEKSFDIDTISTELMPIANDKGRGDILWPLRVAVSGLDKSPGPIEILEVLGKKESIIRIKFAIDKLSS
jgi:glutamyl-tRNA synthetase